MDPGHRDRIAFMRVVSGKFEKDMEVVHTRTGKPIRLTRPQRLFAQERQTVEEAYPGDIVGLTNKGSFRLGDTLSIDPKIQFDEVPHFAPEVFAMLHNEDISRLKHFDKGIRQLTEEGLVDLFWDRRESTRRTPILGAVGKLQFDVVQFRLETEYGVKTRLEMLPYTLIHWVSREPDKWSPTSGTKALVDARERPVVLAMSQYAMDTLPRFNPGLALRASDETHVAKTVS